MTTKEVLNALERFSPRFPYAALEEAARQREAITPELLRILEDTVNRAEELCEDGERMAHIYAAFLLAQFREPRAYPLLARLARLPEPQLDGLMGEVVTENLSVILASVCHGDTSLIEELIEDEEAYEYARSAGLRALLVLVAAGDKAREEVLAYYTQLLRGGLERKPSVVWGGLVDCATHLYPEGLREDILQAYEEDLVSSFFVSFESTEEMLELNRDEVVARMPKGAQVYIQDVVEEMHWWVSFKGPKRKRGRRIPLREDAEHLFYKAAYPVPRPIEVAPWLAKALGGSARADSDEEHDEAPPLLYSPPHRAAPKIGPNQPCPCGSGKKHKKCCGRMNA